MSISLIWSICWLRCKCDLWIPCDLRDLMKILCNCGTFALSTITKMNLTLWLRHWKWLRHSTAVVHTVHYVRSRQGARRQLLPGRGPVRNLCGLGCEWQGASLCARGGALCRDGAAKSHPFGAIAAAGPRRHAAGKPASVGSCDSDSIRCPRSKLQHLMMLHRARPVPASRKLWSGGRGRGHRVPQLLGRSASARHANRRSRCVAHARCASAPRDGPAAAPAAAAGNAGPLPTIELPGWHELKGRGRRSVGAEAANLKLVPASATSDAVVTVGTGLTWFSLNRCIQVSSSSSLSHFQVWCWRVRTQSDFTLFQKFLVEF